MSRMMSSGSSAPFEQERVRHAHHRQVLVRLAPAVAAARPALLARAHEVPHVVGEHAVLDEHVALRGRAFVVDRVGAPLARVRAVVDQRDERRRDLLADASRGTPTRPCSTRSASSPCPHASWNSTPPAPRLSTTGSLPRGAGRARSIVSARLRRRCARPPRGRSRRRARSRRVRPGASMPGLHAGVADRDALHDEAGAHLVVLDEQAVGVGDEDAAAGVGVADAHLADRVALGAGGVVGALQHLDLAGLLDRLGQDPAPRGCGSTARRSSAHDVRLARAVPRAAAAAAWRRLAQPARSGRRCARSRWSRRGRPGCPAPRSRPETQLLDLPSSRRAVATRRSSANTSAKSPPSRSAVCSVRSRTAPRSRHLDPNDRLPPLGGCLS